MSDRPRPVPSHPPEGVTARLATLTRLTGLPRGAALAGCAATVVGIGVVDDRTGPELSWAVFYLLPVVAGTVLAGTFAGLMLSAESALVWVIADALIDDPSPALSISIWNGALRLLILSVVVVLLAGLREASEQARASDARTREFLTYAAHQLRTPISGIGATAEALMMEGATASQEALLANLARETRRAGQLSASLLRVARLDQGEQPARRPCDVATVAGQEVERQRDRTGGRVEIGFTVWGEVPALVHVDGDGIRDALANLLDNARRHARTRVEVALVATPHEIQLLVRDNGPGLPPKLAERAFDRFVSLDGHGGSGLGLPIARGIARSHGGDVRYEGGAFVLFVPLTPVTPGYRLPEGGAPSSAATARSAGDTT